MAQQEQEHTRVEGHRDGGCAAGGWRNPPMALLAARIVWATPSCCHTIRANRYSLDDPEVPSTVQAYQSPIPRMAQTALERTANVRDGTAPPEGRAGTGWRVSPLRPPANRSTATYPLL
jgi:hypothetical protein